MASAGAAVPGRTWWTSKQASTAVKESVCVSARPPFGSEPRRLTAEQIQSKASQLEDSHRYSRVNVPKLPFSAAVNIQALRVLANASHIHKTGSPDVN